MSDHLPVTTSLEQEAALSKIRRSISDIATAQYPVVLTTDSDNRVMANVVDLRGCYVTAATREEALAEAARAAADAVSAILLNGEEVPRPSQLEDHPVVSLPVDVTRRVIMADVNRYLSAMGDIITPYPKVTVTGDKERLQLRVTVEGDERFHEMLKQHGWYELAMAASDKCTGRE